ncbi:multidrug transporter [Halobacteriales archaeon SW_7_65_23]|jgi:uncharacterized membrane protein YgaE (UPF0421/DUF939 family)|nr:MAG: multidrug transporter [Halobacteriales archaeon SW_7_65_23]
MKNSDQSPVVQAFAVLVAVVAIVGSQLLGWEWGGGQLVPTLIGVAVAGVALAVFFSYWMRS